MSFFLDQSANDNSRWGNRDLPLQEKIRFCTHLVHYSQCIHCM